MPHVLISLDMAKELLAELTQAAPVPVDLRRLRSDLLRDHGHILMGDVPLRGYKRSNAWWIDERDVRRAGQALAGLAVDPTDLVPLELTWSHFERHERPAGDRNPGWRNMVRHLMCRRVVRNADAGRRNYRKLFDAGEEPSTIRAVTEILAAEVRFRTEFEPRRHPLRPERDMSWWETIGGTSPLDHLSRVENRWMLPRAYRDLLDRWQAEEARLTALARTCTRCGATGGAEARSWRQASSTGWVTMCPDCVTASFQTYTGGMRGVRYNSARQKRTRADDYLCCLCNRARATAWDHCHDHGFLRGPLCASCNVSEWVYDMGAERRQPWLARPGGLAHLLECAGCRTSLTLPVRYQAGLIARHLAKTERHGRCESEPYATPGTVDTAGSVLISFRCSDPSHWDTSAWEVAVNVADHEDLVREILQAAR
jgi:hypothetical protein